MEDYSIKRPRPLILSSQRYQDMHHNRELFTVQNYCPSYQVPFGIQQFSVIPLLTNIFNKRLIIKPIQTYTRRPTSGLIITKTGCKIFFGKNLINDGAAPGHRKRYKQTTTVKNVEKTADYVKNK